jgi:hypothetical protein
LLALLLVLCLFVSAVTLPAVSAEETVAVEEAPPQEDEIWPHSALRAFCDQNLSDFSFLGYHYQAGEGYFYNDKEAFQHVFGFNILYDVFAFVMFCYTDTIRCQFAYEGKDYLVQLWKGGYGICLFTGGEIGLYSKPADRLGEHYDSVEEADYIGMEMSIYNENRLQFTRAMDTQWWCTGYAWSYLDGFAQSPRTDCTMTAALAFQNAEMAALFAEQLAAKGFVRVESAPAFDTPEQFSVDGSTVHLAWRDICDPNT